VNIHELIGQVHGAPVHRSMRLIKRWSLATGSTARI
jgi:hypothetical protein